MADDFIEEMQTEAKLRFGREFSAGEVADKFQAHDFEARIHHLKNLKTADSFSTVREAARRHEYESLLRKVHSRLRSINR